MEIELPEEVIDVGEGCDRAHPPFQGAEDEQLHALYGSWLKDEAIFLAHLRR
jgi:hypothetical protein